MLLEKEISFSKSIEVVLLPPFGTIILVSALIVCKRNCKLTTLTSFVYMYSICLFNYGDFILIHWFFMVILDPILVVFSAISDLIPAFFGNF